MTGLPKLLRPTNFVSDLCRCCFSGQSEKSRLLSSGLKKDLDEDPQLVDEDFASTTSLHGIAHFIKNKSIFYKLFWGAIFFTCMGICIWQISDRVRTYFSYPTNREIEVQHSLSLPFPAVTMCRVFRYNEKNISAVDKEFFKLSSNYLKAVDSEKIFNESEVEDLRNKIEDLYKNVGETFNFTKILLRSAYAINSDTLKDCKFGAKRCHPEDFHLSFNHKYQFCWTFNPSSKTVLKQTRPGSDYGFKFSLDLQEDEYKTPISSGKIGFKLFFHQPYEYPYIFGTGYGFGPGLQSRATISFKKNTNLEPPYGKCTAHRKLIGFPEYSLVNCLVECEAKHLTEVCGCRPIYYQDTRFPVCDFIELNCLQNVSSNKAHEEAVAPCAESCQVTCEEDYFDVSLSYVQVVNNRNLRAVLGKYSQNLTFEYVQKNYAYLNVYYENFVYVSTQQNEAVTVSSLLSDIGGQLGLFMGMSTLTLVEVFEYFGRRILSNIQYSKRPRKNDEKNEDNPPNSSDHSTSTARL